MIENYKCQFDFLVYELKTNYENLWEILKSCTDLKYCSDQFLLFYDYSKNQTEEKKNEIYFYTYKYY